MLRSDAIVLFSGELPQSLSFGFTVELTKVEFLEFSALFTYFGYLLYREEDARWARLVF